jgi:predicted AAA+ superfamily ATPase
MTIRNDINISFFRVITMKNENKIYVQVAYKMVEQSTIDREFTPLLEIKDNHPKYVITMDDFWKDNIEGVKHMHIADFLLMKSWV